MWSSSYTGEESCFRESERVGVMLDLPPSPTAGAVLTDGDLFEVLNRSVARSMRTFLCHQRASNVCKSAFLKMFGKRGGRGNPPQKRENFVVCLILPKEIYRANKGDTGGAIKQAVEGLGLDCVDVALLPWPTDSREFVGKDSTHESQTFRVGWRKACEVLKRHPGLIKRLGVWDLEVWQMEAALSSQLEDAAGGIVSKPSVHYISDLSPSNPKIREVCFSHQHSVEVVASVDGPGAPCKVLDSLMQAYSKTSLEVLSTWCYQRGIVALPRLESMKHPPGLGGGPEEYVKWKEGLERDLHVLEKLAYPLTRRPVFFSPTQQWSFFLTTAEVEALSNGSADKMMDEEERNGQETLASPPADALETESVSTSQGGGESEDDTSTAKVEEHQFILREVENDLNLLERDGPPDPKRDAILAEEMPAWEDSTLDKANLEVKEAAKDEEEEGEEEEEEEEEAEGAGEEGAGHQEEKIVEEEDRVQGSNVAADGVEKEKAQDDEPRPKE